MLHAAAVCACVFFFFCCCCFFFARVCVRQQVFCVTTHHPSSQMGEWQGEQKQTPCSGENKRVTPTNDKCLLFVCVCVFLCFYMYFVFLFRALKGEDGQSKCEWALLCWLFLQVATGRNFSEYAEWIIPPWLRTPLNPCCHICNCVPVQVHRWA